MNSITQEIKIKKARRYDVFYAVIVAAGFAYVANYVDQDPVMVIDPVTDKCLRVEHPIPIFSCDFYPLDIPRIEGHKTMAFVDESRRIDRW